MNSPKETIQVLAVRIRNFQNSHRVARKVGVSLSALALSIVLSHGLKTEQLAKAAPTQPTRAIASANTEEPTNQKRTDIGILIIGGMQNKQEQFLSYIDTIGLQFEKIHFEAVGQNMLKPDHIKDYQRVEAAVSSMVKEGVQKLVVIGFSVGGKHAARLAIEHTEIAGLVLLDPVDGGPQPDGKTPVFLKEGDVIAKPTLLLASEFGPIPKLLGQACAPEKFAHKHFRAHIEASHLLTDEIIPGTGHTNFLTKPWPYPFALACDNGTADYLDAQKYILSKVTEFLSAQF